MRKLIVWNLMTLDGCFEGPTPWDLSFHTFVWGSELEEFSRQQLGHEGDLLVFGRKTYEGMAAYWQTTEDEGEIKSQMNSFPKICVSRSLTEATWNNTRLVRDPVAELTKLKQQPGKTIFIFGSAELENSLLDAGLIDEIRLCIVPVVLGAGNPHFKPSSHQRPMTLLEARPLSNGAVILRYQVGAAA